MKSEIATSTEQSSRLISCGVDLMTADMVWLFRGNQASYLTFNTGCNKAILAVGDVPAWSLARMLELIPQRIPAPHADTPCDFILHHHPELWIAMYHDGKSFGDSEDYVWQCCSESRADNPIEACVKMIEWLCENDYKLNTIMK